MSQFKLKLFEYVVTRFLKNWKINNYFVFTISPWSHITDKNLEQMGRTVQLLKTNEMKSCRIGISTKIESKFLKIFLIIFLQLDENDFSNVDLLMKNLEKMLTQDNKLEDFFFMLETKYFQLINI